MKFCIIGRESSYQVQALKTEIEKRGDTCLIASLEEIELEVSGNVIAISYKEHNLLDCDIFILRRGGYMIPYIATSLLLHGKVVYEGHCDLYSANKFLQYLKLSHAGLPVPHTYFIGKYSRERIMLFKKHVSTFSFPLVLKTPGGSKGNEVFLCHSLKDITRLMMLNMDKEYLVQEFIPGKEDIRILVLGGNALGAFIRSRVGDESEFRTNAPGAEKHSYTLSDNLKEIAIQAASVTGIDFAGIDVALWNDHVYIFEVNNVPQFKAFEEITGEHVSGKIIDILLEQYRMMNA